MDAIEQRYQEAMMRLEIALGESLAKDVASGRLPEYLYDFAMELITRNDEYETDEWMTQWETWFTLAKEAGWS